ncbi:hypothetical protein V6N13_136101 [Hibiscus sabdariffa]
MVIVPPANVAWSAIQAIFKPVKRELSFIFSYKKKADSRDHKYKKLKAALVRVQSAVEDAQRNGEEIIQDVKDWQKEAELKVQEPEHIVNLVEEVSLVAFPVLESLYLQNLINLEKICNAQLEMQPFAKLREINVGSCYRLKNLFSFSIARGLQQLQEVQVADCRNMVEIITEGGGSDVGDDEATITVELEQLRSLTL